MREFKTVNDILDYAIDSEQNAVNFYTKLSNETKNHEMKEIFAQFAKEEMRHKAQLLDIKEKGFMQGLEEKVTDLKIADYTVKVKATDDLTYQDALVLAMQREKAAFKLYTNLSQRVKNEDLKKIFKNLAQDEAKHKLRFELEYDEHVLREN